MTNPGLLTFEPVLMPKVWGGRRLEGLGKTLPTDEPFGESWEITDLDSTSPTGGGGQSAVSVVADGPMAGKTIRACIAQFGSDLLGGGYDASSRFPLLIKFLDAREHLSVQVHPSPAYAAAHPGAHVKHESWYVIEAEPVNGEPPMIFKGLKPGVTAEDLRRHIEAGTVVEAMHAVSAVPGECHTLPSGTVHALGAGVLVAEVQTPSDTTYRVYDWAAEYGRTARALHIEESLAAMIPDPAPEAISLPEGDSAGVVAATEAYTIEARRFGAGEGLALPADRCVILIGINGSAHIEGSKGTQSLEPGHTVLVPAACSQSTTIRTQSDGQMLVTTF